MKSGNSIKVIREKFKISQTELAEKSGISQTYLSQIEHEVKNPSIKIIEQVGQSLNVPLPILLWFTLEKNDVPEEKRDIYDKIKPIIDNLIDELINIHPNV